MEARLGRFVLTHTARGLPRYELEMWHDGLNKHRLIRGESESSVRRQAELQVADWAARWEVVSQREAQRSSRAADKRHLEQRKAEALDRSADAQDELEALTGLLKDSLALDHRVNWEGLKDRSKFPETKPKEPAEPQLPREPRLPREPSASDSRFVPKLGFLDWLIKSRKAAKIAACKAKFASEHGSWREEVTRLQNLHAEALTQHAKAVAALKADHEAKLAAWSANREAFKAKQLAEHAAIDAKRAAYEASDPAAIREYCELVLASSKYPEYFPQETDLDYLPEASTLVVDYQLPGPDDLPKLKAVKYVASRDEFEEQFISEAQATKQYDEVLYQVVLRSVHELFQADTVQALAAVVINGIVTAVDRTTGKPVTACVLSLRASREEFTAINLYQVDPKACFKALKGVGSSKLHGLSAVPPIMTLSREDARFVAAHGVASSLDESVNLAAMDWEEFEHLIREVFEKEFSSTGGEVKVTQASRDGGVDAVAFDPDPIRGGKIVIQAKRYTNTVGVSAVRDLYGTVMNEGATKGVLVTTSDYGPDSYAFANGKPLVLLSGANLLHMLQKHGHRARIDLREAKRLAG